jgi:Mn-dependent DtxR family transcriptional regulator
MDMRMALVKDKLSPANEDYLEAVFELGGTERSVRSVDLATKLEVSKASVNNAINNLKQAGLVEQPYYGGITLTQKGAEYAAGILERHHVLYHFLLDVLGVQPDVAAEEACKMEHAISDDTLERLTVHLKEAVPY